MAEEKTSKSLLSSIDSPQDLKQLQPEQLPQVCEEIRDLPVWVNVINQPG